MMITKNVSLEQLLCNMNKTRQRKSFVERFGKSKKMVDFLIAIEKLNKQNNTNFYIEHEKQSFTINGHREIGRISRRNGIIGQNIDLTMGFKQVEQALYEHTIHMIVDNAINFIVISFDKMKESGQFDKDALKERLLVGHNTIPYSWSIDELEKIGAIMFRSDK